MSELKNCAGCGRLFAGEGSLCRKCKQSDDDEYSIVRKYVRDYPGASIFEVAEATGVEEPTILHYLRDGRLQSRGLTTVSECDRCGKVISEGKYCDSCLRDLKSQFGQAMPRGDAAREEIRKSSKDRMYTKEDKRR